VLAKLLVFSARDLLVHFFLTVLNLRGSSCKITIGVLNLYAERSPIVAPFPLLGMWQELSLVILSPFLFGSQHRARFPDFLCFLCVLCAPLNLALSWTASHRF